MEDYGTLQQQWLSHLALAALYTLFSMLRRYLESGRILYVFLGLCMNHNDLMDTHISSSNPPCASYKEDYEALK